MRTVQPWLQSAAPLGPSAATLCAGSVAGRQRETLWLAAGAAGTVTRPFQSATSGIHAIAFMPTVRRRLPHEARIGINSCARGFQEQCY